MLKKKKQRVKIDEEDQEATGGSCKPKNRHAMNRDRLDMLAKPSARRLQALWNEKKHVLPTYQCDKLKSALESSYFMTPEQTEEYFQAIRQAKAVEKSRRVGEKIRRNEIAHAKLTKERQKWLTNFSAQIAYRLFEHISKVNKENMIMSCRLQSIADVVLEKVAEILGEPKPSRTNPGRLPRFMVAVSDCIAVWIENNVFRAASPCGEPEDDGFDDEISVKRTAGCNE